MLRIRLLSILAVLVATLSLAGATVASPADAAPYAPAEGLYDSCAGAQLQTICIQHLEAMRRAGFTVVVNYTALTYSDPAEVRTYMAAASALGMKIIWALQAPVWWTGDASEAFPQMSGPCGCHSNAALLHSLVDLVKHSSATWGYYVGDETVVSQAAAANAFSAEIHRDDPNHPRLFVGIGDGVDRLIRPFAAQADVLGADIYPVGQDRPTDVVREIAARLRGIVRPGQRTAMVLQSFGESTNHGQAWPTEHQMHAMLRDASAAHPSLVLWWAYYKILQSRAPLQHWNALRAAVFGRAGLRRSAHATRDLSQRLRNVPDLPAAAARALAVSNPYAAPQLSSGGFLQGFLPTPSTTVSVARGGRAVIGAIGCSIRCVISVQYALMGTGASDPLGAQTFSLPPNTAAVLKMPFRTFRALTGARELATIVTASAGGRSVKCALYQTLTHHS